MEGVGHPKETEPLGVVSIRVSKIETVLTKGEILRQLRPVPGEMFSESSKLGAPRTEGIGVESRGSSEWSHLCTPVKKPVTLQSSEGVTERWTLRTEIGL